MPETGSGDGDVVGAHGDLLENFVGVFDSVGILDEDFISILEVGEIEEGEEVVGVRVAKAAASYVDVGLFLPRIVRAFEVDGSVGIEGVGVVALELYAGAESAAFESGVGEVASVEHIREVGVGSVGELRAYAERRGETIATRVELWSSMLRASSEVSVSSALRRRSWR